MSKVNFTGYIVGSLCDDILKEKEFEEAEEAFKWMTGKATSPIGITFLKRVFIVDTQDNIVGEFQYGKAIFPTDGCGEYVVKLNI